MGWGIRRPLGFQLDSVWIPVGFTAALSLAIKLTLLADFLRGGIPLQVVMDDVVIPALLQKPRANRPIDLVLRSNDSSDRFRNPSSREGGRTPCHNQNP